MTDEAAAEDDEFPDPRDDEFPEPREAQREIIESDAYPMRVRAGAGTGKTFTMVRKIQRLIENGTPPDRILALTFTNKAADSMREKLVETVGEHGYDIEAYTYHAICHELLQEFAYHADLDPRYDIATDADRFALSYEVLDEMPYRFTNPDVYDGVDYATGAPDRLLQFVPAMKRTGITPDDVDAYLPTVDRLFEFGELADEIREAADEHLKVGWRKITDDRLDEMLANLEAMEQTLGELRTDLNDDRMETHVGTYLDVMCETCVSLAAFLDANRAEILDGDLAYSYKLPAHLFGQYSGAPKGMPPVDYALPDKLDAFVDRCQVLSDLVPGYRAYETRLDEENFLDFNDLVLATVDLLKADTIAGWLGDRYDYVFCDEYQDTDTVQFELVQRIAADADLFVVGDDDQAIYEWRGANVENIGPRLDAACPKLHEETLDENFRSNQPILDLANDALSQLDVRASEKELAAVGDAADADAGVVTIDADEEPEDEAAQLTNALTRLLNGDTELVDSAYDPSDIAILVRKKRHARPIAEALTAAGIPYELGGDLASEAPGVETVIAALKALADPLNEVALNRVLAMRYRVSRADLERLNDHELPGTAPDENTPLHESITEISLDELSEPSRVETARDHLGDLWAKRDTHSLSRLYQELKSTMRIEWFLSEQERHDLRALDEVVSAFEEGAVEPELSGRFVEFLDQHDVSDREMADQPETQHEAVSIMTIHKSKGLEFPVVVLPQLRAGEWAPRARSYDVIEHVLDGGSPLDHDFAQRDEHEARRLLHVGITRAEELSILSGRRDDESQDSLHAETVSPATVAEILPENLPWAIDGVSFPIWETIQESLPLTAVDGTETIAAPVDDAERVAAIEAGTRLSRGAGQDRVLDLAKQALDGELDPALADSLPDAVLGEPAAATVQRRHSYTSLDTFATCQRQHYLSHVVRAFDDPAVGELDGGDGSGPSQRQIGILFHDTAERAADRGYTDEAEWRALAERLASLRGEEAVLPAVEACIERFFETDASSWEIMEAERSFELTFEGETVVGMIDALCRRPDGELVVLDYKATQNERSLDDDLQLPIYLLACENLFDEPVRTAGYTYVGEQGPRIDLKTFTDADLEQARAQLSDRLSLASESAFEMDTAGYHCMYCPHRSLSCSDEAGLTEPR
ncbi:ATP-dependent helicase [Halorubellus sp. JP-L1]|uniref:ATP-dependent helicase n=1 Tax=Halorubellus sp. JP-L1 TaxID=2715753 RepID=UPI00140E42B8|nr:ATP-dependent DNA helicase [Halorubellus sp. JP-L1]NHN41832.1 ATP-dependent helicase [Halorubellus sp. JP-L1]